MNNSLRTSVNTVTESPLSFLHHRFIARSPAVDDLCDKTDPLMGTTMKPQSDNSRYSEFASTDVPARKILLIDDDRDMAEMLVEYLGPEGYKVHPAYTAKAGIDHAKEGGIVLIILDVMLPDQDGFSVLREIRQRSHIPIIMFTTKSAVLDKVSGLQAGADDHIPKPFTPIELLARIRTVLRRGKPTRFGSSFLAVDDMILDAGSRTVECHGNPIDCTAAEIDILYALLSSAGQAVTREHLTRIALGRSPYVGDRGADNLMPQGLGYNSNSAIAVTAFSARPSASTSEL